MSRTSRLASLALLGLLALPAAASADTSWTRVSSVTQVGGASLPLEWTFDGPGVVGAWVVKNGLTADLEVVRFTPSRAAEAANATQVRPQTLAGWDFMAATVFNGATGVQALVTGQFGTQLGPPSGTNLVALNADGSVGPLQLLSPRTPDMLTTVLTAGGPLWAGNAGSTLYTYTPARPEPASTFTGTGAPIGGCCGYIPRLAYDQAGRLWMVLYSNATGQTGIYIGQLDPATGVPVTPFLKAPQSEASDNNSRRIGFACAAACRVVYEETDAGLILPTGRLVTWAYGEGAPTVVGGAAGANLANPALAYRVDGRLWVSWIDAGAQRVYAKLGDGSGAGGRVQDAGAPPLPTPSFLGGMTALPLGDDVLLNVVADQVAPLQAQFVNLVLAPGAVDTGDVPDPKIVTSPGGKLVYPGTVTGRCVRVRPVADKPARIWAQVFSGRRNGSPVSNRVRFRFTAPGAKSKCVTLQAKPKGFYTGKVYRIKFEVRTGANAKPIEATRPPWRTQPQIKITL